MEECTSTEGTVVRNGRKKRQAEWDMLELRESIVHTGSMLEVAGRHSFPSGTVFLQYYGRSLSSKCAMWPQIRSVVSRERYTRKRVIF